MTTFVLVFFLLLPNGNLTTNATKQMYIGADLCLSEKEVLDKVLMAHKAAGQVTGYSSACIDSKLVPGLPV